MAYMFSIQQGIAGSIHDFMILINSFFHGLSHTRTIH